MASRYSPTASEKAVIKRVYGEVTEMKKLRKQKWKYFNDRTLQEFIEDSQLRLNGYVPSRESQGKEPWQSNVFHPVTRNKFKAMLASVALDIPQVKITAQNEKNVQSRKRADIMKHLTDFSYDNESKEEQIMFEGWEAGEKGTVIVYDGYLKSRAKRKIIKSYDPETGDIETEEKEVEVDNQCINFIVPLLNLYVDDWTIFDIQKQPAIAWIERMDKDDFKNEFGKYKNGKYVEEAKKLFEDTAEDSFFREYWQLFNSKGEEQIEVIRYYNKQNDEFIIIANGVLLFESPLILGKKKKWYPFAKTVFEPLATDFFYGNSLPNTLMGEQDVINALYNMALDKTYRSMVPPMIIGMINKDDFDLEDQNISTDTRIYVQDVAQAREMPIKGLDQADLKMIELVSRGLDLSSVDSNQQGVPGRGVTAREVVIANENAKKLKGIMYLFLTSLWVQKIKLRMMNILVYYTKPKVDEITGKSSEHRTFTVGNAELSDGSKGTLDIQMVGSEDKLPKKDELDIEEMRYNKNGTRYEKIAITSDFLDDWIYDIKIVSDSLYQKESGLTQLKTEEKLRVFATYFPQLLLQNSEKLATDTIISYEDDPDDYQLGQEQATPQGVPGQEQPGQQQATAGQAGLPSLPKLQ